MYGKDENQQELNGEGSSLRFSSSMLGNEEGDQRRYRGQDLLADLAVSSDKDVLIAPSMAADYLKAA